MATFRQVLRLIDKDTQMTQQEFEQIYTSLSSRLRSLAEQFRRRTAADIDPDDVVQEAMTAFWELSENGYAIQNPTALLVKITKNICISRYRKQKLRTEPIEGLSFTAEQRASSNTEKMDEKIIRERLYQVLTRTERLYMILKTEEDLSLDEIAKRTGSTKTGIKTALYKARKKLKEQFRKEGYDK